MRQVAFVVVVAVLFDTFIVRSLLVPALMSVLGEINWWPAEMPVVTHHSVFGRSGRVNARAAKAGAFRSQNGASLSQNSGRDGATGGMMLL